MASLDRHAVNCPGCRMPIVFDAGELGAPDEPETRDVMCAFCGTVTTRLRLVVEGYVPEESADRLEAVNRGALIIPADP